MDTKLVGLVRLHLASLARIADIFVTCNRLFRLTVRLRRSRLLTQLYVGKRPISKRDRESIRKFVVPAFGARSWNVDVGFRATRRTAECFATHRPLGRYSNRDFGRIERESDCLHGKIRDLTCLSDILPTGFHGAVSVKVGVGSTVYVAGAGPVPVVNSIVLAVD
jgi:hypothetical protein